MRSVVFGAALAVAGLFSAPLLAADATGLWLTPVDGGQIEITRCGANLCGAIVTSKDIEANPGLTDVKNSDAGLRGRKLKGLTILTGFSGGPKEWTGGKVYNADDGKTYSGTITLENDTTLKLRGCVIYPLCETQTWTRLR
ncbi:DUF2147 domain-containing protein [Xanthobacter sp. KR7-65]|uniref:DUF2147 domain-containing protein n=1 Tax=Xanthobacter sp. KR7-65 TaxID=3156612 RepID=UPI0032B48855